VAQALDDVRAAGADQALVCGSGPTVMGVYWGEQARPRAEHGLTRLTGKDPRAVFATPRLASQ
jgi:4-diphosphocytidyl-2-C-methyl-D-erythritol kinase